MRKKGKTGVAFLMAGVLLFTNSGFVYGTELEAPVQLEEEEMEEEQPQLEEEAEEPLQEESGYGELQTLGEIEEWETTDVEGLEGAEIIQNPDVPEDSTEDGIEAEGSCGVQAIWKLDEEWNLVISGSGEMNNYGIRTAPWSSYDYLIKTVTVEDGITSIGESAFKNCSRLNTVTLSDSITAIHRNAFENCSSIEELYIPEKVTEIADSVFSGCEGLKNITLPEMLKTIGDKAFSGCSGLSEVAIPEGVESIGESAFNKCSDIETIDIPENVLQMGKNVFSGCSSLKDVYILGNIEKIGDGTFSNCIRLDEIQLPESVNTIGAECFLGCSSLKTVDLPDSVTTIGVRAFSGCGRLESLGLPEGVSEIQEGMFLNCRNLQKIELPESIISFGNGVFENCSSLETIGIPEKVSSLSDNLFSGCNGLKEIAISDGIDSIGNSTFSDCSSLERIELPSNVTSLGIRAFSGCTGLKEIDLSSGLEILPQYLFGNCRSLKTIQIPKSVRQMDSYVFYGCTGLEEIDIPERVEEIPAYAFSGCRSLKTVGMVDSLTSIGRYAFENCSSLKSLEIPDSVRTIASGAFSKCSDLENIHLPKKLHTIEESVFGNCSGLESITISSNIETIENYAFQYCSRLGYLTMEGDAPGASYRSFSGCPEDLLILVSSDAKGYDTAPWTNYKVVIAGSEEAEEAEKEKFQNTVTSVTASEKDEKAVIKWKSVRNAKSYRIYRKEAGGNFAGIVTVPAGENVYVDTTVAYGIKYYYTVKAFSEENAKGFYSKYPSDVLFYMPQTEKTFAEAMPQVSVQSVLGNGGTRCSIRISWNRIDGAKSYRVYQKEAGGKFVGVGNISDSKGYGGSIAVIHPNVKMGKTYYYTVKGFWEEDAKGTCTKYPAGAKVTVPPVNLPTPKVTTKSMNYCTVDVSWNKIDYAEKYVIYRKEAKAGTSFKSIKTVDEYTRQYRDSTAKMGTKYYYTVKAYVGAECSGYQKNVTGTALPSAPSLYGHAFSTATQKYTSGQKKVVVQGGIGVRWTGSKSGANTFVTGYRVFRKTKGESWKTLATVGKNVRQYKDTTAKKGTTYYYTVRPYVRMADGSNLWGNYDKNGVEIKR